MNKRIKLINKFEKKHKYIEEDGFTDCSIVENEIFRVTPKRKDWLGDDESYKKALKEQKETDKIIRCYVCEFIKELKQLEKNGN